MSIKCVNWVLESVYCKPELKMLLIAIADRSNDSGVSWPNQTEIARKSCVSVRTVKRKIQILEAHGVIEVHRKRVEFNKLKNTYRLCLEKTFNLTGYEIEKGDRLAPIDDFTLDVDSSPSETTMDSGLQGDGLLPSDPDIQIGDNLSPITKRVPNCHHIGDSSVTQLGDRAVAPEPSLNRHKEVTPNDTNLALLPPAHVILPMTLNWQPGEEIIRFLVETTTVPEELARALIPEFALINRGETARQSRFENRYTQFVRKRWEQSRTQPFPINRNFAPDKLYADTLEYLGIPRDYIDDCSQDYLLYWLDRPDVTRYTWQKHFFDYCVQAHEQGRQFNTL